MEIAQVLYDVQFVAYLRKTFLEDTNQMAKGGNGIGLSIPPSPSQHMMQNPLASVLPHMQLPPQMMS